MLEIEEVLLYDIGFESINILGTSYGGYNALLLAKKNPSLINSVIAVNTPRKIRLVVRDKIREMPTYFKSMIISISITQINLISIGYVKRMLI